MSHFKHSTIDELLRKIIGDLMVIDWKRRALLWWSNMDLPFNYLTHKHGGDMIKRIFSIIELIPLILCWAVVTLSCPVIVWCKHRGYF